MAITEGTFFACFWKGSLLIFMIVIMSLMAGTLVNRKDQRAAAELRRASVLIPEFVRSVETQAYANAITMTEDQWGLIGGMIDAFSDYRTRMERSPVTYEVFARSDFADKQQSYFTDNSMVYFATFNNRPFYAPLSTVTNTTFTNLVKSCDLHQTSCVEFLDSGETFLAINGKTPTGERVSLFRLK